MDTLIMEEAVLGCMVSSGRMAAQIADVLEARDFQTDQHRILFATMVDMLKDGQRVDELTIAAELRKEGFTSNVADPTVLYRMAAEVPSVDNGMDYAVSVREASVRRQLIADADRAASSADAEDVLARMERAVFDARSRLDGRGAAREITAASAMTPLEAFLSDPEGQDGYPYPVPSMRERWGLYERGRYTLLGGYSGDGKSAFAFQWVEELCEAGAKVCIYELEMTELQVSRLLAIQGAGITPAQAKGIDPMSMEDLVSFEQRRQQIAGWDLTIKVGPTTPAQIRADQVRERYDIIVVDHMHKFERTSEGEYVDMTRYSGQLHRITRDLGCSVIALLQLKKPGDGTRPEPTTASIRGAGAMEEDADDVLFIYRKRVGQRRVNDGLLLVAKMRDGETDKALPVTLIGERVKFFETGSDNTAKSVLTKRQEGS